MIRKKRPRRRPEGLVPILREFRREGLKEVVKARICPSPSPTKVGLVQLSNEGDQFVAAADIAAGGK
ncbi:hypothetical protein GCM10023237_00240 [Streptomyces coeruleoprunus]